MTDRPAFRDHFSRDPGAYARFRPRYPAALFEWVAAMAPARRTAWDCATGSGQAATMLAAHFARVIGSDASRVQLAAAEAAPRVRYVRALGESSALRGRSVDLVTVAQALHWLDRPRFYAEVDRVLAAGGALAVWCYGLLHASPAIDAVLLRFYDEGVGAFWPPPRVHVERGYRDIEIPIEELDPPPFAIEAELSLAELLGYVGTWSAVGRFTAARGHDPVDGLARELAPLWGDPDRTRRIVWPLSVRAGRWLGAGPTAPGLSPPART
jgi:SAM-dependent methyltransferase